MGQKILTTPDVEHLISQLGLQEKVSLLSGADLWHTVAVERLGIPAMKMTDGPNGARGAEGSMGLPSACFPCGAALAATWDPGLVERVGQALGQETQAKGAHILLGPTVNIHRTPLAGRNFECFSEDPYLAARMAVAYIRGVQSQGVGACIKHFVCNDSEFQRQSISSVVRERPLREIYLAPFYAAVREARPWAVMSAYNRVNGTFASENARLLIDILRDEWGFDGIVISDWFGTYSPNAVTGGLDLEMPGPARWMGEHALRAVQSGEMAESAIDCKVRRILNTLAKAGRFEHPELEPEQAIDRPEHRRLAREAAAEAAVLLKNERAALPLNPARITSIAVIGANAKQPPLMGGGSAAVTPHYAASPLEAIRQRAGAAVRVDYEPGCPIHRMLPALDPNWLTAEDGRHGFTAQLFEGLAASGLPAGTHFFDRTSIDWTDRILSGVDRRRFSAHLAATFTPPETGRYAFSLGGTGAHRLWVDGAVLVDCWADRTPGTPPWSTPDRSAEIDLKAGQPYQLAVDYASESAGPWRMLRIGCLPPAAPGSIERAAALAARSDVAVVFAGLTGEWESEGADRPDLELRGAQVELIEKVAAANPNTVVVLNTGSPVVMPWLDNVPAVVQAWFAGQEAGNAVADVLFGDIAPSGKLPQTFPKRLQDTPAYLDYPGENGQVFYGEGLFVGYRYYDRKDVEPLFPFGHGLSYTTFAYRNLRLSASAYPAAEPVQFSLEVENTGARAGKEVVQVYVRDRQSSLARADKELKAFCKVALQPGETKTVAFTLDPEALCFYDPARRAWAAEPGTFEILVGGSSRDIRLIGCFELLAS